jgi:hypothetical protein
LVRPQKPATTRNARERPLGPSHGPKRGGSHRAADKLRRPRTNKDRKKPRPKKSLSAKRRR